MWNIIMWTWLIGSMFFPLYILIRTFKSKPLTWNEFYLFAIGLFIGGIPAFYAFHLLKIVSK